MSCNCGSKINKLPCCCKTGTPAVCPPAPACPDAQPCDYIVESDCVTYNGTSVPSAGVTAGMTVTEVINVFAEALGLNCIPARCIGGNAQSGLGGTGYYQVERNWPEGNTYTFTLNSLLLNGVEYANGNVITITSSDDLVVGTSTIDGYIYVMNINDWLNSIPGVSESGFVFHDDMHVIDKPDTNSKFTIAISSSSAEGGNWDYFYTSGYGFSIADPSDSGNHYTCEPIGPFTNKTVYWSEDNSACAQAAPITVSGDGTSFCNSNTFTGSDFSTMGTGTIVLSYGGNFKTVNVTVGSNTATFNGGCDPC